MPPTAPGFGLSFGSHCPETFKVNSMREITKALATSDRDVAIHWQPCRWRIKRNFLFNNARDDQEQKG
jgi:hypothetical protein